jgi:3,4-dihydroxy 2-butanone 4-phosphate synthase / GTP cyclohydrolase II
MNSDGSMAKGRNLFNYAKKFNLNIARIEDLIAYRLKKESLIKLKRVEQVKIGKSDTYQVKFMRIN